MSILPAAPAQAPAAEAAPFDWEQVETILTESRQSGLGEILVTGVWGASETTGEETEESRLRERLRRLGFLRATPAFTYGAHQEDYFERVAEAQQKASKALVDPYTQLLAPLHEAQASSSDFAWLRSQAASYAHAANANLRLGLIYLARGQPRLALKAFSRSVRADPHEPEAWRWLGLSFLLSRQNGKAVSAFGQALDLRPGDSRLRLPLALAHYHNHAYSQAEEGFRRELAPGARGLGARSFLACCLRMQQKWPGARREAAALAAGPGRGWPRMSAQCLECVERGEAAVVRPRRRPSQMWKHLLGAAAVGLYLAYGPLTETLRHRRPWLVLPIAMAVLAVVAALHRLRRGENEANLLGRGEPGLPCWQWTAWLRPQKLDLFGAEPRRPRR